MKKTKHKIIGRIKSYDEFDCYGYTATCSCGEKICEWTEYKAEEKAQEHIKQFNS